MRARRASSFRTSRNLPWRALPQRVAALLWRMKLDKFTVKAQEALQEPRRSLASAITRRSSRALLAALLQQQDGWSSAAPARRSRSGLLQQRLETAAEVTGARGEGVTSRSAH